MSSIDSTILKALNKHIWRLSLMVLLVIPQITDSIAFVYGVFGYKLGANQALVYRIIFGILLLCFILYCCRENILCWLRSRRKRSYSTFLARKLLGQSEGQENDD